MNSHCPITAAKQARRRFDIQASILAGLVAAFVVSVVVAASLGGGL